MKKIKNIQVYPELDEVVKKVQELINTVNKMEEQIRIQNLYIHGNLSKIIKYPKYEIKN